MKSETLFDQQWRRTFIMFLLVRYFFFLCLSAPLKLNLDFPCFIGKHFSIVFKLFTIFTHFLLIFFFLGAFYSDFSAF